MDQQAFYKIGYGLYVLTAREGEKDNGCIINTLIQVTDQPCRISITVNKRNLTCGMIERTGKFNVSVISEEADFALFQRFGYQSGRTADKFDSFPAPAPPTAFWRSRAWRTRSSPAPSGRPSISAPI